MIREGKKKEKFNGGGGGWEESEMLMYGLFPSLEGSKDELDRLGASRPAGVSGQLKID